MRPLVFCLALVACGSTPKLPAETLIEVSDYPDDDGQLDACSRAARNLWRLGCFHTVRRVAGMRFGAFCRSREPLIEAECIASARDASELATCRVTCRAVAP